MIEALGHIKDVEIPDLNMFNALELVRVNIKYLLGWIEDDGKFFVDYGSAQFRMGSIKKNSRTSLTPLW